MLSDLAVKRCVGYALLLALAFNIYEEVKKMCAELLPPKTVEGSTIRIARVEESTGSRHACSR